MTLKTTGMSISIVDSFTAVFYFIFHQSCSNEILNILGILYLENLRCLQRRKVVLQRAHAHRYPSIARLRSGCPYRAILVFDNEMTRRPRLVRGN